MIREDRKHISKGKIIEQDAILQDIWKLHIDVQEQMLRLRSVPVRVLPESAKVVGEKLYLTADENEKSNRVLEEIATDFKISFNEINIKDGYFFADVSILDNLMIEKRMQLSERFALNFVSSSFMPVIDGYVFCKENVQKLNFEDIESNLLENFPSLKIKRDIESQTLYFCQEYETVEQGYLLKDVILSELDAMSKENLEYTIYSIPEGKIKITFEVDNQAKQEAQSTSVRELRGTVFSVENNDFGKLIQVSYPKLVFDISGDNFEKTKQLFYSKAVALIEPNLIGDLEKINRLKDSLNNILSGKDLQNSNLKEFIFDASKAKPIDFEEVNEEKDLNCGILDDFKSHILNKHINESQIDAIIKTLLAEDLALIQGPPGTGKSTAIAEMIWQHIRSNSDERILLTSETNLAVDNAIDRIVNSIHNLVKPVRIGGEDRLEMEGRQFSIEAMKRWVKDGVVNDTEEEKSGEEELLPQKLILQNWIDNIKRRAKKEKESDDEVLKLWLNILSNPTKDIRQIFYDNYLKNCNVIGATCSSIAKYNKNLSDLFSSDKKKVNITTQFYKQYCEVFGTKNYYINKDGDRKFKYSDAELKFTTVIQDESSKATPAELSLPLIYGKKNIIIGDHRQLPPMLDKEEFVMSLDFLLDREENKEEKRKIQKLKSFVLNNFDEMEKSHFERLFHKIDDSLKGVFNLQYRMHPDINDVIKQFYTQDNGLECGLITPVDLGVNNEDMRNPASRYHGIEVDGFVSKDTHTIWIDTNSPELLDGTSRINYGEVEAIKDILIKLQESESFKQYQSFWKNLEDQQIGIISFYGKQIKLLRDLKKDENLRDFPIRVSTVDRFQGMERNIIIVSMVRSNRIATHAKQKPNFSLYPELGFQKQESLGFAQSPNRLNVALSRAKRLLIIVGNSELFRQKNIYDNVYRTIESNPNSKIIKYNTFNYTNRLPTPTITLNRSLNINTRDIQKTDEYLRSIDTWFSEKKENPKIAVLELSTKAVKMLFADQEKLQSNGFDFSFFIRDTQKTETGNGLDGNNKMDMNYFNKRVLPEIQKRVNIIKQNKVDVIYCVATAAYRTASNRDDIIKTIKSQVGINVRILSKQEEAEATLWAYTFSTKDKERFIKAKNIIMIDQGGGSTEISIFENQHLVKSHSFEIGTTVLKNMFFSKGKECSIKDALIQIDKESTEKMETLLQELNVLHNGEEIYCVCVGTAITEATPGRGNKGKHDKVLTRENLSYSIEKFTDKLEDNFFNLGSLERRILTDNDLERVVVSRLGLPVVLEIMKHFRIESFSVSGTGLWYGVFFKELYKID